MTAAIERSNSLTDLAARIKIEHEQPMPKLSRSKTSSRQSSDCWRQGTEVIAG
jgi:hypothetical protein